MATDTVVHEEDVHSKSGDWEGGKPVFRVSYGKLMMWYFFTICL